MIEQKSYDKFTDDQLKAAEDLQHARFLHYPHDEIWDDIVRISAELLKREVISE